MSFAESTSSFARASSDEEDPHAVAASDPDMASWIFGGSGEAVDLTAAERAIEQLSQDRDAVSERAQQLQQIADEQK